MLAWEVMLKLWWKNIFFHIFTMYLHSFLCGCWFDISFWRTVLYVSLKYLSVDSLSKANSLQNFYSQEIHCCLFSCIFTAVLKKYESLPQKKNLKYKCWTTSYGISQFYFLIVLLFSLNMYCKWYLPCPFHFLYRYSYKSTAATHKVKERVCLLPASGFSNLKLS